MKKYKFTLNSDSGIFHITLTATSIQTAINVICNDQNCPESTIINIKIKDL